jgi:DNA-binding NtrC family response regulator
MPMDNIHILHVEDNPADVVLIQELLTEDRDFSGTVQHVSLLSLCLEELAGNPFEVILLDLNLPDSSNFKTFLAVKKAAGDIPIIVMTDLSDEKTALRAVKEGAQDYLLKVDVDTNLLVRSIRYAIEREKLTTELRKALVRIKTLSGLLPICAACKNIRDDEGFWHQVEEYVRAHSEAEFTHSICPVCAKKLYPEYYKEITKEDRPKDPR